MSVGPAGQVTYPLVSAGPAICRDPPSAGFNYSDTDTIRAHSGYSIGISASGRHCDGTQVLRGSVQFTNVGQADHLRHR